MKPDPTTPVSLLIILGLVAVALFSWRRQSVQRQLIALAKAETEELQNFVLARLDAIGQLLEAPDITVEELRRRSDAIISELQSRNANRGLDALISDVEGSVSAEIRKRQKA